MADSRRSSSIKEENDFLKMKIMLQHGGEVGGMEGVPPEIENIFLRNVVAFEEKCADAKKIKVFEKIGSPSNLKPATAIADADFESEWKSLQELLNRNGIDLVVCSPNVSPKDLYRFAVEELINLEIDDISIPGMMTCFIYDEFYPDDEHDNMYTARNEISAFFEKRSIYDHHYEPLIQVNNKTNLPRENLSTLISRFQSLYDEINNITIEANSCDIRDSSCIVKGKYSAEFSITGASIRKSGEWTVGMQMEGESGLWRIATVLIEGIEF